MFDFEQIMKGYTKEDEFIARDLLLIELLVEKEIITTDEINKKYKNLEETIEKVKKDRKEFLEKRIEELENELKGDESNEIKS